MAPTSLSANFCSLSVPCPVTICPNGRKSMEGNQVRLDPFNELKVVRAKAQGAGPIQDLPCAATISVCNHIHAYGTTGQNLIPRQLLGYR